MSIKMREKLLKGMTAEEIKEMDASYEEYLAIFNERDVNKRAERMAKFGKDQKKTASLESRYVWEVNKNFTNKYARVSVEISICTSVKHSKHESHICYGYINGKESFQCLISCGHWQNVKITDKEMARRSFNLLDHLAELVPTKGKSIGLITFQNGINNSWSDFTLMGQSILRKIYAKPLCIGLYNPTKGLMSDAAGVLEKLGGQLSDITCITHRVFTAFADQLEKINPELLWAHFAHSEGGLIAETMLTMLKSENHRKYFKNRLLAATYGAVLPIPRTHAKAINSYSSKDGATLPRVQSYLAGLGDKAADYNIRILPAEVDDSRYFLLGLGGVAIKAVCDRVVGDHGFQNTTYQDALRNDLVDFAREGKFYESK